MNTESVETLRTWLRESDKVVFFGGAGVSTASGIPDFRSAHGIYAGAQGRSYEEMLSIGYFTRHPDAFWRFYKDVMLYPDAKPNAAHDALAHLEAIGKLKAVVTQNIDGLHQMAGSRNVCELHGTELRNLCTRCGKIYTMRDVLDAESTPHCACDGLIRPDIVLYGESLDGDVIERAIGAIETCDLLIVGGTSLVVQPAASFITYRPRFARLVLINRDETPYDGAANLIIRDSIAEVLSAACADL